MIHWYDMCDLCDSKIADCLLRHKQQCCWKL